LPFARSSVSPLQSSLAALRLLSFFRLAFYSQDRLRLPVELVHEWSVLVKELYLCLFLRGSTILCE
jgi:hypothetical protein